jgi:hypothetical protein
MPVFESELCMTQLAQIADNMRRVSRINYILLHLIVVKGCRREVLVAKSDPSAGDFNTYVSVVVMGCAPTIRSTIDTVVRQLRHAVLRE